MWYIKICNLFEINYVSQLSFFSIFVPLFHSLHFFFEGATSNQVFKKDPDISMRHRQAS